MRSLLLILAVSLVSLGCAKGEPKTIDDPADSLGGAAGAAGFAGSAGDAGAAGAQPGGAGGKGGAAGEGSAGEGQAGEGQAGESSAGAAGESQAGAGGAGGEGSAGKGGAAGQGGAAGSGGAAGAPVECKNEPVINEILTSRKTGDTTEDLYEFLELTPTGDDAACSIDLTAYKVFRDGVEIWDGSSSPGFKKGKFFVLAGATFSEENSDFDKGFLQPALPIEGACIEVRKGSKPVDKVCYGNAGKAPAPEPGKSIGRVPDGTDTGDDGADFKVLSKPSPRAKNN